MSESNSNQGAGNCGPACEGESLIIEVMGKDHPEGHSFRIFDETNYEQQEWLENKVRLESLEDSVLHLWPRSGQPAHNIWLDIDAEEGAPIRVSFFSDVDSTPRQLNGQWNRIWPIVPLTALHDANPEPGQPSENVVPVRSGFIYIFRSGTLWRELEVGQVDTGKPGFRDVRLSDYREPGLAGVTEDRRAVVGKALPAIWLPVCQMNATIMNEFQLAFSEVQFSVERIAYLERDAEARMRRCQTLQGPEPAVTSTSVSGQSVVAPGQLMPLASLPEMRSREPYLEQRLPRPWKQVYDLAGTYASNLYSQAKEELQAFCIGGTSAEAAWESARYRDAPLIGVPAARADALDEIGDKEATEPQFWQPLDASEDVLSQAKENQYAGVILEDKLFSLRRYLTRALDAHRLLTRLLEEVEKQPHSNSAQLVHRLMGPERLAGKENPLHQYLDSIETSLFGPLHTHLLTAQRQLAREELVEAQKMLAGLVRQTENQIALADLFSLAQADYIEGFALAREIFQILAMDTNSVDHLARTEAASDAQIRDANDLVLNIVKEGSDQPLHNMLFPPEKAVSARSEDVRGDCGDGRCRPEDLKKLPEQPPEPDEVQTLTAAALAALVKTDSIDLSSELKRWMGSIGAILDGIDKHVRALANRMKSQTYRLDSRLYGPLLRMAKARDPALLSSVQLVARNAVPQGWLILGLSDPASGLELGLTEADREYVHRNNGHRRFYGEYLDRHGNPLASTRKSAIPDLAETAEARQIHVYAAPENSAVVRAQRDMRRLKSWDEFFNRVRMPYLVLMIEGHNIWREFSLLKKVESRKGLTRAGLGIVSAGADLFFAGTIAVERLSTELKIWGTAFSKLNNAAFQTTNPVFQRLLPSLARAIPKIVTKRMLGGLVTAGLSISVSLLDMVHEWDSGDLDASVAFGVSAVGSGMMAMGALMMVKMTEAGVAPILLGMGPWGWVLAGATLAIGAGILATILDDPPLVDWLKRGPFGPEQDNAYPHLVNSPNETFYRLIDLLTKPRISFETVNDVHARLARDGYEVDPFNEKDFERINTVVRIENNLSAILDDASLRVSMRLVSVTRTPTHRGIIAAREILAESPEVLLEQPLINGKLLYMALPRREIFKTFLGQVGEKTHDLLIRAQWQASVRVGGISETFVFPAPELYDGTAFNRDTHGEPDFTETGQVFWANERSHRPDETT